MRLAVNLRLYVKGEIGGIENYVRHVLHGIAAHQSITHSDWLVFARASEVENVRDIAPGADVIAVAHETSAATIKHELERTRPDLFFCPLLVLEPLRTAGIPSVVTIPDLQHEFYPQFFDQDVLHWRRGTFLPSAVHASLVFTISEYSKSTIVEQFRVDPEKVVVVGLDVDPEFKRAPSPDEEHAFEELTLPEKYIYYPANFWKHKNHSTLLRALKILVRGAHSDLHLVLTGAPGAEMDRVKSEAKELGVLRNVVFLGYKPRAIVAEIYRHARALAFASLFEGFGIPILEAFHLGTPVVTSRTTSCPEVAGDAAILVDERNAGEIATGIHEAISNDPLRRDLIQKGKRRTSPYSWPETVDTTLSHFETVIRTAPLRRYVEVQERPLVTVVTPAYNMGRFIEETIQSVLAQDYPAIEYLVMDGGSTDDTLQILRKYEGRLRYSSGADGGQADAINRGFALSSGQIFTFLNADDTYLPGAVTTAVNQMIAHKDAGVVYGDAYYVREDGSRIGPYPTLAYDFDVLSRNCFICQPAAFMRRDAFVAAGGMNVDLQTALDYDLWIRIAKIYPLMKIDGFLATSRMYRENKTLSRRKQVFQEIIRVVKAHYGFVPYDWLYGYAAYLVDRSDPFFEPSQPSLAKQWLALLLGCGFNQRQLGRYWKEWSTAAGVNVKFTGRWSDGWISREYEGPLDAAPDCARIVIAGRHVAPFRERLTLLVTLNGTTLKKAAIQERGPFRIDLNCPPDARGRMNRLKILCNATFRPWNNGDHRQLSCIIDEISTEGLECAKQ